MAAHDYRDHSATQSARLDAQMEMSRRGIKGASTTVLPAHHQGAVHDVDYHEVRAILDLASNGSFSPYAHDNPSYRTVTVNSYATTDDATLDPTDDAEQAEYMVVTVQAVIDVNRLDAAEGVLQGPVERLLKKQNRQQDQPDEIREDYRSEVEKQQEKIARDIGAVAL
ncbi:hypothetical protein GCM10009720_08770 [Yaniella flava]|uniref:Uncharacterized protein n=1 Tax=Yaniella flava TaxID=287930 RepID=A0ABN2U7D9_9MICC